MLMNENIERLTFFSARDVRIFIDLGCLIAVDIESSLRHPQRQWDNDDDGMMAQASAY
jgi:hypothetical protein